MAWRGFITESKLYMNYPGRIKRNREGVRWEDLTPQEERRAIRFWLRLPIAYLRFQWFELRHYLRRIHSFIITLHRR